MELKTDKVWLAVPMMAMLRIMDKATRRRVGVRRWEAMIDVDPRVCCCCEGLVRRRGGREEYKEWKEEKQR